MNGSNEHPHEAKPSKLPHVPTEEVIKRAQRIFDKRGRPPYNADACLSADEAVVLSEFVHYWQEYLVEKSK